MSGFCGRWNRDGEPVSPDSIQVMMEALKACGPDGSRVWRSGTLAFGHQMLFLTPQSKGEILPWQDEASGLVITCDARLDNRAEVCAALRGHQTRLETQTEENIGAGDHPARVETQDIASNHPETQYLASLPDSQIILRAYQCWGQACVEHLLGAYSFAIWDAHEQRLFCAVDAIGELRLFYYLDGRNCVFGTEVRGVLAAPGVPKALNERTVANWALQDLANGDRTATYYAHVKRLDAGTTLTVSAVDARTRTYWQPDPEKRLPYRTETETIEALRELIFDAVRARLRTDYPVAALLSGGLDSSSLTACASRILAGSGRSLITLSSVSPDDRRERFPDERAFIDEFRSWPNLDMVFLTADGRGPFDSLPDILRLTDAPNITSRHYLYSAFCEAATGRGARVVLDGVGGEFGPSSGNPSLLLEWFLTGKWNRLWREAKAASALSKAPVWRELARWVVLPLLPDALRRRLGRPSAAGAFGSLAPVPLRMGFIQRVLGKDLEAVQPKNKAYLQSRADYRIHMARIQKLVCNGFTTFRQFAGQPVVFAAPFADRRLFEFCLAAPGELKFRNGYGRNLIRASMEGILPPVIQWRTSKAPFSPDYMERYNQQRPQVEAWLGSLSPHDPVGEIVDLARLKEMASQPFEVGGKPRQNAEIREAALHFVPLGVYLIHFLRQFAAFG